MFKSFKTIAAASLVGMLLLSACSNESKDPGQASNPQETPAAESSESAKSKDAIKQGTVKLQEETTKLQEAIQKQDAAEVKRLGKSVNDIWISYENTVRQTFPLEYTDVEKYEMPIFSASAYDKVDFTALKGTAEKLQEALTKLLSAKETTANTSEILNKAVANYKVFVDEQADNLAIQTKVFAAAVKAGDMEKAKLEYTKARVYFETIEPIAESFGELDPKIDARLADVENESEWTGYHRIEKALWLDKSLEGQDKYADQLIKDTEELQAQIKSLQLEPKAMVAGAMELLNEAATSKITGEEELYSRTDLVDLAANVYGSKTVYLAIIPALNEKNPDLGTQLDQQFMAMEQNLMNYQKDGEYVTYDQLTTEQIRQISDQLSQLSNLMSQTASIL
ncbi:iron uptake system protein EfeO [Paenibacillus eucommiae]|uniref:Iron uptake system component EfeO n=1 Tax=Paenibacillus eucommiae TaxID=1355755 RepID=A0ABS4J5L5_9BACL|nr:iron uptake system protein EfeO [Paenibacillus eucommiae]MBP1995117.1 iron uptake system component EfeO [Paenibacillus eucommiae]